MRLTIVVALGAILVAASVMARNMQSPIKETYQRVVLVNGNELYAWCAVAQRVMTPNSEGTVNFSGSIDDAVAGRSCWVYIQGVIDSTPSGGEFNPGPNVRFSQYVDVVTEYLRVHANIRNQPASKLIQNALRESFSHP